MKSKYMWSSLLKLNKPDIIIFWIHSQFGGDNNYLIDNLDSIVLEKLSELFKLHSITPNLINMITNNELSIPIATQEIVLNELSKFGIFCETEESDMFSILRRLIATESLERIDKILSGSHCSINIRDFNNLIKHYCIENNLFTLLNVYSHKRDIDNVMFNKEVQLIISCKEIAENLNDLDNLAKNIYDVDNYLSNSKSNLALLSLFVLNTSNLMDIFLHKTISIKGKRLEFKTEDAIENCLSMFSSLKLVYNRLKGKCLFRNGLVNVYDLLKLQSKMDVGEIYEFRIDPSKEMMHFKQDDVVKEYGYNETVNFLFYLKQCRPCVATKVYLCNNVTREIVSNETATEKTHKLAIANFSNDEITASCITFLDLINISANKLQLHLKIANILIECKSLTKGEIVKLFDKVNINSQIIMNQLEQCMETKLWEIVATQELSDTQLVELLKGFSIGCQFCRMHNLKLPEKLLISLAKKDMWLPFILCVQQYDYPSEQVKKLTLNFSNSTYLEHINHSIVYDTVIHAKKEMLMKERDSRTSFLSRIGVRQKDGYSSSSDGMCSSISSSNSLGSNGSVNSYSDLLENEKFDSNYKTNLLQVIIYCHNSSDPPKALLQACEQYKNPLLAVLAASYEVTMNYILFFVK